jgi:predicted nucleotidyltransferase
VETWGRLGPPARRADYVHARRVARELAREFAEKGARAVLLSGSWARREARRSSDLDLWVLGKAGAPSFLWREPFLVSVSRINLRQERRKFLEPPHTGELLGAWRTAVTLYDPHGEAGRLRDVARRFRWEQVSRKCDRWVARTMVAYGEEAVKIVNSMARGQHDTAAVVRNLLANSLVFVVAVHRRIAWVTDNGLWARLGREEGSRWWKAQRRALALNGETLAQSAGAALELYALTARRVRPALGPDELATIERVCAIIHRERTFRGSARGSTG